MAGPSFGIGVQAPSVAGGDIAHLAALAGPDAIEAIATRPGATVSARMSLIAAGRANMRCFAL